LHWESTSDITGRGAPVRRLRRDWRWPAPRRIFAAVARWQDHASVRLSRQSRVAQLLGDVCGPCKIEMPWFVELQNQYASQGFQIVGVAMDDASKEDISKFAKDMGVNYPSDWKESVGDEYGGVPALPESFLIWTRRQDCRQDSWTARQG